MAIPSEPGPIMVTVQWPCPDGRFDDVGWLDQAPIHTAPDAQVSRLYEDPSLYSKIHPGTFPSRSFWGAAPRITGDQAPRNSWQVLHNDNNPRIQAALHTETQILVVWRTTSTMLDYLSPQSNNNLGPSMRFKWSSIPHKSNWSAEINLSTRRLEATLSQIAHIRGLPSDFKLRLLSSWSFKTLRTHLSNWLPIDLSKRASSAAAFSQHSWPQLAERQEPSVPQHSPGTLLPHNRQHPPKSHTQKPVG